jgi:hypothetical protein
MKLLNRDIYEYANLLSTFHIEGKVPVKISFFLQKNIQTLIAAAREIDEVRVQVIEKYGSIDTETGVYNIPPESIDEANKELFDFFMVSQDLNIHTFNLNDFDNIELTYEQMSIIMFMIEE